jgi:hypothetical protein
MEPAPDQDTTANRLDDVVDVPIETPADDAAEQALPASTDDDVDGDETTDTLEERGLEVNEADAAEQARSVGLDDDYR